jgi:hypothetical protein
VYDLATAAWFAFSIGLLARGKVGIYYLLFPLGCLNRETAFLMTLLFLVHFGLSHWRGVLYQAGLFVVIRALIVIAYADLPGFSVELQPASNWQLFAEHPLLSAIHWTGFAVIAWLCVRNWSTQPVLLRQAFLVFAPALLILYLLFGVSFELRVFAELYPVAFALIYPIEVI